MELNYASKGVANTGLGLGIAGTALGLMNGGAGLLGLTGKSASCEDQPVTRYDIENIKELMAKDQEIAILRSEQNTEIKIADVYERLITRINADQRAQAEVNAAQSVFNATSNSAIAVLQNQIAVLNGLTKTVIPNSNVCPGWGSVTVTPNVTGTVIN